jgi:cytochrome c556
MLKFGLHTPLAIFCVIVTLSASAHGNKEHNEDIKYRTNIMSIIGGHMGAIAAIVKGKVPYNEELVYHAQGLAAAAPKTLPAFETKATSDNSSALPVIWVQWPEFEKAALQLEQTTAKFSTAAAAGNMADIGAALGDVGKSCKGCHDDFTKEH